MLRDIADDGVAYAYDYFRHAILRYYFAAPALLLPAMLRHVITLPLAS